MSVVIVNKLSTSFFLLVFSLLASSSTLLAWGKDGHSIVAQIAENHLNPTAKLAILDIAGGDSLSFMANWPDTHARRDPNFNFARSFHYVNLPKGQFFDEVTFPAGRHALWAIDHFSEVLVDPSASDKAKWQALAWILHFVGDIHQPLHCGYKSDKGGNSVEVRYPNSRKTNLHKVWDTTLLIENGILEGPSIASRIDTYTDQEVVGLQVASLVEIANESRRYLPSIYRLGQRLRGHYQISADYEASAVEIIKERLAVAGIRLAGMLNEIFQDDSLGFLKVETERFDERQVYSGYYSQLPALSSPNFRADLNELLVGTHLVHLSYKKVWDSLELLDEDIYRSDSVFLFYTKRSTRKGYKYGWQSDYNGNRWAREHVWPKSHGFPKASQWAYTDIHHLVAADQSVNNDRRDHDFAEISDSEGQAKTECSCRESKTGRGRDAKSFWEPSNDRKGDVARMIFYMAVRYDGGDSSGVGDLVLVSKGTDSQTNEFGVLEDLLQWHEDDPVSMREKERNKKAQLIQGNRNPFVDHPEWVETIWF